MVHPFLNDSMLKGDRTGLLSFSAAAWALWRFPRIINKFPFYRGLLQYVSFRQEPTYIVYPWMIERTSW